MMQISDIMPVKIYMMVASELVLSIVICKAVINLQTTVQGYTLFDHKQMNNSKPTRFHGKFILNVYVIKSNKQIIKCKARYGPKKSD